MTTTQWRTLTYVLAVIFLLLVAIVLAIILSRTGGGQEPDATVAVATATASASSGSDASASASPLATPSGGPSPSGLVSPTASGAVPPARAIMRGLGVDDPDRPEATPRVIVFTSEGGGDVTARLLAASGGRVELCIYPGTLAKPLGDRACLRSTGGTLTGHAQGKKPFTWTVTLAGVRGGTTPAADVRIDWPTTAPRLELVDVRLQGTGVEPYDSVHVDLGPRPSAGTFHVAADWSPQDGVADEAYRATITDRDTERILEQAEGTGSAAELSTDLAAGQRAAFDLTLTEPLIVGSVLADLVLTWP
ncbi:MAG TPA: hypothetical protein VIF84_09275 [Candidatus Limnocylindrales bacterium]